MSCVSLLLSVSAFAQDSPADDESYQRFLSGTQDVATLAEVLPLLSDAERRPVIRAKILEAKTPPRTEMVALLDHPILAVRLGALELLEELAGGDLSYNPWTPAESPENLGALARWNAWAGSPTDTPHSGSIFSEDQHRSYLRDLLAENHDKAARARRMLEAEGLSAVGFLETFLNDTPTLSSGARSRIREAQYQITLARQLGDQAAVTARHLAFGSRDQRLSALTTVRSAGMLAVPILRDFITHPDPLIRETAIDSLLVSAGQPAVAVIAPLLTAETDVNVIHGALRRLKDIRSPETQKLVTSFLTHPDEDLLVSAIQTSLTLSGDNERFSFGRNKPKKSPDADPAIIQCLSDPRWRVRATALEFVAKRKLLAAKEQCLTLLDDPDDFVRFAAINAIVAIGAKDALPKLKAMLLADDSMIGPIIDAYGTISEPLDAEILAKLDNAAPAARLAAVRSSQSNDSAASSLALRYASDPDIDVACAALRVIASDDDKLKQNKFASVMVAALRSNSPEKATAILERLDLPSSSSSSRRIDPMLLKALQNAVNSDEPTALDPLYNAFLLPGADAKTAEPKNPEIPAAQAEILRELAKFGSPDSPPALRFSAALNLAKVGQVEGYTILINDLPSLTTAQKTTLCSTLDSPSTAEAIPLLTALLRDPVPEVRSAAAECAFSNDKAKALISLVLTELTAPDGKLQPFDVYCYRFDNSARSQPAIFRPWCLSTLQSETSTTQQRILAAIAARHCSNSQIIEALRKHTTSTDTNLRRAAWHSLITARPAELSASAEAIAKDPEAFVRAVLPDRVTKPNYIWSHHFSDTHTTRDNYSNYSSKKIRIDDNLRSHLTSLASHDPSPLIRFETSFALLAQSAPIDLDAFVTLLPKLSKETNAIRRITDWLEENATRATPALSPLLAIVDATKISADKLKILNARISPSQTKGIPTFASLASNVSDPAPKNAPLLAAETATPALERKSLIVAYFYKPGCQECIKAKQYINSFKTDFPLIEVKEYNILDPAGLLLNQSLCAFLDVPSLKFSIAPAVFTQSGFVIGSDISPASIGKLFAETMATPQDDTWIEITDSAPVQEIAAQEVDRRYESITLPIVLLGGLLDGINPCAFATIIFFLSYLQIARRTPREMLMVGAAFISAVFIAYLAAGLLLHEVIASLNDHFAGIQRWMNLVFGSLALVAAYLSFRDALRARAGRLDEMTLQLPGMLKDRIRGVIRSGARARNFVIAAFLSGLVISLLELACTGQVYAPIIYQIQKGRLDAVLWLVVYNLAFITPLIVIFLLAYGGLRSETLVAFQKKHTFSVKLGLALLFLFLALFILFGSKFLLH